jgi:acyl-CoA thioester hydrolase
MPTTEQADGRGAVPSEEEVYRDEFTVPEDVIDRNGHVNNVAYVQWMQDAVFAGDRVQVRTWVVDLRRVRSLRRYEFVRVTDGALLARGETEWVLVDAVSGRPCSIPEELRRVFPLVPEGPES